MSGKSERDLLRVIGYCRVTLSEENATRHLDGWPMRFTGEGDGPFGRSQPVNPLWFAVVDAPGGLTVVDMQRRPKMGLMSFTVWTKNGVPVGKRSIEAFSEHVIPLGKVTHRVGWFRALPGGGS